MNTLKLKVINYHVVLLNSLLLLYILMFIIKFLLEVYHKFS